MTIPDTVTYIEGDSFCEANIGTLYYRAEEAPTTEDYLKTPFREANIGELSTDANVRIIPKLNYDTRADHTASGIMESTFHQARVNELTIGEGVTEMQQ